MLKSALQSQHWPRRSPARLVREAALLFKAMPRRLRSRAAKKVTTRTERHDLLRVALSCSQRHPKLNTVKLLQENNTLGLKLLKANAELRLKTLAVEHLECLVRQRNQRIDALFAMLEQARQQNAKLNAENEHLAHLIAASPDNQPRTQQTLQAP